MPGTSQAVTYILGSFPDGIEPFVFNELKDLSRLGFSIRVFSVYGSPHHSDDEEEWVSRSVYAEPLFSRRIILSHLYFIFTKPSAYWSLLRQYHSFRGKKVFWKSVFFARQVIKGEIKHVHAHFAWVATDAARLISKLTGITYSLTAHQSDINRYADANLREKLEDAQFILTCTKGNREYLREKFGKEIYEKTTSVYHGVDIERFRPKSNHASPGIDILSVGSLLEIKGFEYLIKACAILKSRRIAHKCLIIGRGPRKDVLEALISQLDLRDTIEIKDPVPHDLIRKYYADSKVFVLPVVQIDGAPHGIPNVLAEAMSMGLPVVSTNTPNIPELVENDRDGILVSQRDPQALADVIEGLLKSRDKCTSLGNTAREKIEREFNAGHHILKIAYMFSSEIEERRCDVQLSLKHVETL